MQNKKFGFQKGQTLMEILIYVAIFGTVAASLVGIVWNVTKIHSYQVASNEVDSNLRYAMNLINDKIRGASSVESAADSTLVLKMPNNTTTTFSVTGGVLYIQEGSTDPVAVISDRAIVSSLTFEKIDMAGAKGGARITMTLNYVPKEGDSPSLQKTLISAITRSATAITFSEDIVPGQDNSYSVGSASYGWKNGYFSGDLTVDGTISGTTFCISSDCKTAWPSGGGGTVTGSGTINKVSKWTSSTALGDSIIVDNGTNVSVGETNPASGAVFSVVGNATFAGNSGAWNGGNPYLQFSHDSTTSYIDQNSSGRNIHIRAKNSGGSLGDQLFIQNGGNIGIGTTAPNYPLHIHSAATGTDRRIQLSDATSGSATTDGLQLIKSTDQSAWLWNFENAAMHFGTNGAESLTLLSGGNVGVGTDNPGAKLEAANTADEILRLSRATASYPTKFKVGTDSAFVINSGNSDVLAIKSGKVGIGLTSPTSTLTVAGTVESTTGGFKFPDGTTQTTAASGSSAWTTSGNDIYNSNSGNVGIGVTAPTTISGSAAFFASATPKLEIKSGTSSGTYEELLTLRHSAMDTNAVTRRLGILMKMSSESSAGESNKMGGIILDTSSSWANGPALHLLTANQKRLTIDSSGNVGIGTTGPNTLVHAYVSSASILNMLTLENYNAVGDSNKGEGILFQGYYKHGLITGYGNPYQTTGGGLQLQTYSDDSTLNTGIVIDRTGNVGIGTASPGAKLEVSGNIKLSGASPTYTITNVATPTNSSDVATKGYVDGLNQSAVAFRYAYNAACPTVTGVTLRVAWFWDDLYDQWTTGTDCGSRKHCVCYYSSL